MSAMMIIQFLILTFVVSGVIIFFLKKILFDSTQGAVNRLNRETEEVRAKQAELNEKIKLANEELVKRRSEADELVNKMKEEAMEKANAEREKVIVKARSDAEEIISKAQRTKDEMRKVLEKEMEMKTMDFSGMILKEILSNMALKALNDSLIDEFLESLKNVDMDMISLDVTEAKISSPLPLSEPHKNRISDIIRQKLDREITIKAETDKTIMSGIVLEFGSLKLDGSLSNMVFKKGTELKEKIEKGLLKSGKS